MNIIKEHIDYLKDNPEGYWFKRKLYGWGWTPAKPQGWVAIIIFVIIAVLLATRITEDSGTTVVLKEFLLPLFLLTLGLIYLCYAKGEKPKWQWGKKDED